MRNNTFLFTTALVLTLAIGLGACSSEKKPALKGNRVAVLQFQEQLKADSEAQKTALELPAAKENTAWPQAGGNAMHTPENLVLNSGKLKEIWSESIGSGSEKDRKLITVPIAAEGRVFAADTSGKISAFSIDKGKKLWEVSVLPKEDSSATVSSGLSFNNNVLYITDGVGHVLALNAVDGKKIWAQKIEQPVRGSPTVQDGRLYVITISDETYALNQQTGDILWHHTGVQEAAGLLGAPSPAVDGSVVITAYSSGDIVALRSETGQEAWTDNLTGVAEFQTHAVTQLSGFRGFPVLNQNVAIVGNASNRLVAEHVPSGERIWQKEFGVMGTPWLSGNMVFAVTSENQLVGLLKDNGQIRWTYPLTRFEDGDKENPIFWSGPIMAGDRLIVAGSNKKMLEIDPSTGVEIRRSQLPDPVMVAPIVVQKTLIVLLDNGTLVAYR